MNLRRMLPSPAMGVALLALVVAVGGTAVAANKIGTNQIKNNAVTKKKIKKKAVSTNRLNAKAVTNGKLGPEAVKSGKIAGEAVTGSKIAPGAVDGSKLGDGAVTTDKLGDGSVTSSKTSFYGVSALENVTAAASQAAAPEVTLLTRGPFTVYGKCFVDAAQIDAEVYIKTSEPGTLFSSNTDDKDGLSGAGTATGYLNPGTLEAERIIQDDADANANDADGVDQNENWFNATNGVIAIEGRVLNYAKQGTPTGGDGPFGAGNRCIFHAWFLNQAG